MMSVATIRELSREAAQRAEERGDVPFVFDDYDLGAMEAGNTDPLRSIPNLGTLLPNGWERVDPESEGRPTRKVDSGVAGGCGVYLVDKSGMGDPREPALTIGEFLSVPRAGYGYAIVQEGQFQIEIGVFREV